MNRSKILKSASPSKWKRKVMTDNKEQQDCTYPKCDCEWGERYCQGRTIPPYGQPEKQGEEEKATPEEIKSIAETSLILYIRELKKVNGNALDKIVKELERNQSLQSELSAAKQRIEFLESQQGKIAEDTWDAATERALWDSVVNPDRMRPEPPDKDTYLSQFKHK
jgi:hypothetical protein